jgi:hypothetical protein
MWWLGRWLGLSIICDLCLCGPAAIVACGLIVLDGAGRDAGGTKRRPGCGGYAEISGTAASKDLA